MQRFPLPNKGTPLLEGDGRTVSQTWFDWLAYLDGIGAGGGSSFNQNTAFATQTGGVARSIVDRSRDWIVAHDYSDGSGTPANDLAALNAAVAAATGNKGILLTRAFRIPSTWTISGFGTRVQATGGTCAIIPTAAMSTVVKITAPLSTVSHLAIDGSTVAASATAITVDKGSAVSYPVHVTHCTLTSIARGIDVAYASDTVKLENNWLLNCTVGMKFFGGNYSSRIHKNFMQGMGAAFQIVIQGGTLQTEGCIFSENEVLNYTTGAYLNGSYANVFRDNIFGNGLSGGTCFYLETSGSNQNNSNSVIGNFIGGDNAGGFGSYMTGVARDNIIADNEFSFWQQAGVYANGANIAGNIIRDNRFRGTYAGNAAIAQYSTSAMQIVGNRLIDGSLIRMDGASEYVLDRNYIAGTGLGIALFNSSLGILTNNNMGYWYENGGSHIKANDNILRNSSSAVHGIISRSNTYPYDW